MDEAIILIIRKEMKHVNCWKVTIHGVLLDPAPAQCTAREKISRITLK
jgi:hypothetical protein